MDLLQAMLQAGGGSAVGQLASSFGLSNSQTESVLGQLAPALAGGLAHNTKREGGLESLLGALTGGGHAGYLDDPSKLTQPTTVDDGNGILGHIFGSKDVSRQVAARAAANTGVSDSIIKKMLPIVATMAMGAMAKKMMGGGSAAAAGAGGGLGDALGGTLGGLLGGGGGGGLGGMLGQAMGGGSSMNAAAQGGAASSTCSRRCSIPIRTVPLPTMSLACSAR